jgi:lipopolysaccharide/colanic/teichoic acid biosynthesis glycosyltransferase
MYSDKSIVLSKNKLFWLWKRAFDILFCILLLPIFIIMIPLLFILNNFYNKGNIFYVQRRMGKDCIPFNIIKFRSMISQNTYIRGYNDPIEVERILPFGKILRNTRLDEIPQILNVLKGEMSLIGPRPDYYEHALYFINEIENYSARHCIRPGLSGLSQIRLGYAEGINATKEKVCIDLFYIENIGFLLDIKIFFNTIISVLLRSGK